eukprot:s1373_g13.t1
MNESCWVLLSVSKNPNSPNMPVCRRVPLTGKEAYLAELLGLDEPPDEAADGAEPAAVEAAAAAAGAEGERRPDFRKTEYAVGGHGRLRHYEHINVLQAICTAPGHGDCRMERSLRAHRTAKKSGTTRWGQGRPVGLLVNWLRSQSEFHDQQSHMHEFRHTLQSREDARAWWFATLSQQDRDLITALERPQREGEGMEPEAIA